MNSSTPWNDWASALDGAGFGSHGDPYPDNKNDIKRGVRLVDTGFGSGGGFDATKGGLSSGNPFLDNKSESFDTKRGVCLPDAGFGSGGGFDGAKGGLSSGNPFPDNKKDPKSFFFVEPDALVDAAISSGGVTRGIKLSSDFPFEPGEGLSSLNKGFESSFSKGFEQLHKEQVSGLPFFFDDYDGIFDVCDRPPRAPTGKYSGLSATMHKVKLVKDHPSRLGNSLLKFASEFLSSQSIFAELLKPIPSKAHKTKYSVKLLTFVQSSWCQAKVRIYEESTDMYLIEFQRRSGDSLAFNSVYRAAEKYLQDQGFTLEGRGDKGGGRALFPLIPPSVPLPPMEDGAAPWPEPECMFGPVFDLAKSKCARYQAEGATAIAEMAKAAEGKPEQFPWTDELAEVLYELLEVQEVIVAFPTIKALHSLAKVHAEARAVAAAKEEKLNNSSSSLVRSEAKRLRELVALHGPARG
jgi:hypothetical protein